MRILAYEIVRLVDVYSAICDRCYKIETLLEANREYFQKNKADISADDLARNIDENKTLRDEIASLTEDRIEISAKADKLLKDGWCLDYEDFSKFARYGNY